MSLLWIFPLMVFYLWKKVLPSVIISQEWIVEIISQIRFTVLTFSALKLCSHAMLEDYKASSYPQDQRKGESCQAIVLIRQAWKFIVMPFQLRYNVYGMAGLKKRKHKITLYQNSQRTLNQVIL